MTETYDLNIIHPRKRFVALPLWKDSNLRDLTAQTGNVQKTSFPFGCPYKWCPQPLDSIDVCFDPPCPHSHQPLLASDNLDWLSRLQNYKKNSRKISFLIKIFEKFGLFKKLCYLCPQKYEDSWIRQSEICE